MNKYSGSLYKIRLNVLCRPIVYFFQYWSVVYVYVYVCVFMYVYEDLTYCSEMDHEDYSNF
ncbi:MAG: hypothetical protein K0R16_2122 [Nitrososphaeraceae archaeon]|jgi:hypothetical protein|nr:hypothetical protein [Nitrososphaeraceae archaeon]MDF2767656.1 hypothetical protein [Nitrososphaeraceae archaeon]